MKYLKDFELITESDSQTYRKLQFIREQIRNITKTIRDVGREQPMVKKLILLIH